MYVRFLPLLVSIYVVLNCSIVSADVLETFSGSGSFSSSGGQNGFDNSGWFNVGSTPGSFQTNGSGEQVYLLDATPVGQNALNRFSGDTAFRSTLNVTNPVVMDSQSGIRFGNIDSAFDTVFINLQQAGGQMVAHLQATLTGNSFLSGGTLDLAAAGALDQVTFRFDYAPDLVNGGGLFNAFAAANGSDVFQQIGTIDGSFYSLDPSNDRQFSLNIFSVGDLPANAEFNHFQASAVPEPISIPLAGLFSVGWIIRRRRKLKL